MVVVPGDRRLKQVATSFRKHMAVVVCIMFIANTADKTNSTNTTVLVPIPLSRLQCTNSLVLVARKGAITVHTVLACVTLLDCFMF